MHEIYLAEKIIGEILNKAKENKALKVLEVKIVIPKGEHFTEKEFENILKMQAEDTLAEKTIFKVFSENTEKIYIKDMKIS